MSKTVFDALLCGADAYDNLLSKEAYQRWDNFSFSAGPRNLEGSVHNPLAALGTMIWHLRRVYGDIEGETADPSELAAITGLDARRFNCYARLDAMSLNEIFEAAGKLAIVLLASMRNEVRLSIFTEASDAEENILTAVDDFAERWAKSQMSVALQIAGRSRKPEESEDV